MAQQVQPLMIGCDVDSQWLQINIHGHSDVEKIANSEKAIRAWLGRLAEPACLALEATGRYHQALADLAQAAGVTVYVVNPRQLLHYREGVAQRAKTDPCDARLLARFLARERDQLRPFRPLPKAHRAAWQLLKRRAAVVRARQQLRQSIGSMRELNAACSQVVAQLDALVQTIERQMIGQMRSCGLWPTVEQIQTIPGIGVISAICLVLVYHRGEFRSADAFVAFLGLDVRVRESGRYRGRRKLTKTGDGECRRILYNAAMAGRRTAFKNYYERLRTRGLATTQACVAVARKQVRVAYSLIKNNQSFSIEKLQCA